jgi:cyclic-di-GMP phosphodiesterase TipF (flagellum assembly factor)
MFRITAIFVAVCMVLIAGSAGAVAYLVLGLQLPESGILALGVLMALVLYNMVSGRVRDRTDIGGQIADLSRGTADLARQVAELGRRVAALESENAAMPKVRGANDPLAVEIGELGGLMKQLAETVAVHDGRLASLMAAPAADAAPVPPVTTPAPADAAPVAAQSPEPVARAVESAPKPADAKSVDAKSADAESADAKSAAPVPASSGIFKGKSEEESLAMIRGAVEASRIDLYLQPILTLPQRKVRYYEAMTRLRLDDGSLVLPGDFMGLAERAGLMPRIDNLLLFRCVQVLRRLLMKNREIGLFCNISLASLNDPVVFPQLLQFLEANRALAPSLTLEFMQDAFRSLGPLESESLVSLREIGFRFSMDQVQDLQFGPRDLSERGIKFVKVPASLLLNRVPESADIHTADLSDLLGRHGISLIAERIEAESVVVDLLDYDVRFGQGFLFSPPRPVRAEALQGIGERNDVVARDSAPEPRATVPGLLGARAMG